MLKPNLLKKKKQVNITKVLKEKILGIPYLAKTSFKYESEIVTLYVNGQNIPIIRQRVLDWHKNHAAHSENHFKYKGTSTL